MSEVGQKLGANVGGGTLNSDYAYLEVSFTRLNKDVTEMYIRVEHQGLAADDPDNNVNRTIELSGTTGICTLYAGNTYDEGTLYLDEGDVITVFASGSPVVSSSATCKVKAYNT